MAAGYEYQDGQSTFFVLTALLCILLPWTWQTVRSAQGASSDCPRTWMTVAAKGRRFAPGPVAGWNDKSKIVKRFGTSRSTFTPARIALVLAWIALGFVSYQASQAKAAGKLYDPFAILEISPNADDKAIKRHYRKLSLKFHPDKLELAPNQTKEEADGHFVELTKAYKALTDEVVRKNYEEFGHPDGKQDFAMGIALPSWVVDSKNRGYVIGIYGLVFGVLLPYLVGRWWYSARTYTKDNVLNDTAAIFFRELKEDTTFDQAVQILASAAELRPKGARSVSPALDKAVRAELGKRQITLDPTILRRPGSERAAILLYAHLLRVSADDASARDVQRTVAKALALAPSLANFALAYSWLPAYLNTFALQSRLQQAVHPSLPSSLQIPSLPVDIALELAHDHSALTVDEVLALPVEKRSTALKGKAAEPVARHLPRLEVIDAVFKVVGERVVTPGSFVQLIVRVKVVSPDARGLPPPPPSSKADATPQTGVADMAGEETDMSELLGRKRDGADGEIKSPAVHAPLVSGSRRPTWQMLVADHKLERIFVPPIQFVDIGCDNVRTLKATFQAPQGAGLYTFQTYVVSDSYVDTDVQCDMKLRVDPPNANEVTVEDEISDPDEDTIAGQMAAMRGQPVKRIDGESDGSDEDDSDDDSTSGSEEEIEVLDSDSGSD